MATDFTTKPKIQIGTCWLAGGRAWEVYELLPGGRAKVRSGFRFGEMTYRSIRLAIALAEEGCSAFASANEQEPVAYMRDLDGTGSFHVCAAGDPGSFPVFARVSA